MSPAAFFEQLRNSFTDPLPGKEIQYLMASAFRQKELPGLDAIKDYRESAVCILLYERDGVLVFPLIERVVYEGVHSGQIAFPGGKKDATDPDLRFTARRELFEETGVQIPDAALIGALTKLYIPPSNFMVYPFVATIDEPPVFNVSEREVQQILEVPLEELMDDTLIKETTIDINGYKIKTPYFDIRGKVVWGATAMMLNELKYIIASFRSL